MLDKYEMLERVLHYLSTMWDKIFYVFIGSAVQVFMLQRSRHARIEKGENLKPLTKGYQFGVFITAVMIGWMAAEIVSIKGFVDYSGIAAGMASIFSLGLVGWVQDNLGRLLDKYTKK